VLVVVVRTHRHFPFDFLQADAALSRFRDCCDLTPDTIMCSLSLSTGHSGLQLVRIVAGGDSTTNGVCGSIVEQQSRPKKGDGDREERESHRRQRDSEIR